MSFKMKQTIVRKMFHVYNGIFLMSCNIMHVKAAFPIDIVTEKVSGDVIVKPPQIIPMIPDKESLIRRSQTGTTEKKETARRYRDRDRDRWNYHHRWYDRHSLHLKYVDSHYDEYYDVPFTTVDPGHYKIPGLDFGFQVAKGQAPDLMAKVFLGGWLSGRKPRHRMKNPPRLISAPDWSYRYDHVRFYRPTRGPRLGGK